MIKNIIIALLLCTCGLLYAQNRNQERRHSEEIADVVQNTSDELLAVCEEKITQIEDNCYLYDNFTSYDGFTSFVPNNVTEFFNELENDFERLSQVMLEFYILRNLDADAYQDACSEIAIETIWQYIAPVKTEETEETK